MLTDEFLERIFANEEMQKIPIGMQSTVVKAFQEVLDNGHVIYHRKITQMGRAFILGLFEEEVA